MYFSWDMTTEETLLKKTELGSFKFTIKNKVNIILEVILWEKKKMLLQDSMH